MTKKTLGYVRLEWTCPSCGSINPGPQKTCDACGAPQPEEGEFEQAAQEKRITDETELARAKAGPDIHCAYCGARNPAGAETCVQCGAAVAEGKARASGRVMGAHRSRAAKPVPCPSCGAENPATARECSQCGASMARPRTVSRAARRTAAVKSSRFGLPCGIIFGAAALLFILFIILSSRTKDVVGRVEAVEWTRTIAIEQLGPVSHEDWRDEIPSAGSIGKCTRKAHHTQNDPAPNAEEICGTPYTVDKGSGYGEVVQDCQYQVYEQWCEYTLDEWRKTDQVQLEGDDLNPGWPASRLGANQREGERDESYRCIFDADGKDYTYKTGDLQRFTRCEIGSRWTMKVNTFNAVTSIEPAD